MNSLKDLGIEQKYEVFKLEDIEKLSEEDRKAIYDIFLKLHCNRVAGDKKPVNEYLVVNVDEPYAHKVADIINGKDMIDKNTVIRMLKDDYYGRKATYVINQLEHIKI